MRIWGRKPSSQGFHSIYKWMKPILWRGCCGCIFHGKSSEFRGGGGSWNPPPLLRYAADTDQDLPLPCPRADAKRRSISCTMCVLQPCMNHKRPPNFPEILPSDWRHHHPPLTKLVVWMRAANMQMWKWLDIHQTYQRPSPSQIVCEAASLSCQSNMPA
jgi:hypothetical protein